MFLLRLKLPGLLTKPASLGWQWSASTFYILYLAEQSNLIVFDNKSKLGLSLIKRFFTISPVFFILYLQSIFLLCQEYCRQQLIFLYPFSLEVCTWALFILSERISPSMMKGE